MKVPVGDIVVGYTSAGEGLPVVLIHGLAEDRQSWSDVQRRLHGYRTYACDLRGHGETTLGNADGTLAQLGRDLTLFLETVTGPAACVGYSLGGTVVLWTACTRPDLVQHAVVAGTSSVVGRAAVGFFESRMKAVKEDFSAFSAELRNDTAAQIVAARDQLDAVTRRRLAAIGDGAGYLNAARAMIRLADEPLTPLLQRVTCRVDVIQGEQDVFCPRKAAEILRSALLDTGYREIEGAGHLMSIDQPQAYAQAIQASLDERSKGI